VRGFKPNEEIWKRVNEAIFGENAAVVCATIISGLCSLLKAAGVAADDDGARIHLAAMVLSPDDRPVGSLIPRLQAECARLDDGRWRQ
jgi:hypothetical protein